ncbi:MAG: hypothetical protein ACOC7J_01025, partial [Armatimonadota bacterium]
RMPRLPLMVASSDRRRWLSEAAGAGFWSPEHNPGEKFPKLQILTIEELLVGANIDCRYLKHGSATFRRAPRTQRPQARTEHMNLEE